MTLLAHILGTLFAAAMVFLLSVRFFGAFWCDVAAGFLRGTIQSREFDAEAEAIARMAMNQIDEGMAARVAHNERNM